MRASSVTSVPEEAPPPAVTVESDWPRLTLALLARGTVTEDAHNERERVRALVDDGVLACLPTDGGIRCCGDQD